MGAVGESVVVGSFVGALVGFSVGDFVVGWFLGDFVTGVGLLVGDLVVG